MRRGWGHCSKGDTKLQMKKKRIVDFFFLNEIERGEERINQASDWLGAVGGESEKEQKSMRQNSSNKKCDVFKVTRLEEKR